MNHYYVVTPKYPYTEIVDEYGGPTYDVCDVIEIEAETKRDAIKLGVSQMLNSNKYKYCKEQRADDLCPYTGVTAEIRTDEAID